MVALFTGVLNLTATLFLYRSVAAAIGSPFIRVGLLPVLVFLPFRVVAATTVSADSLTLVFFSATVLLTANLLRRGMPIAWYARRWTELGGILALGITAKYSVINYIPGLALILCLQYFTEFPRAQRKQGLARGIFGLSLPVFFFAVFMLISYQQHSYTTTSHFRKDNSPASMNWSDLLFLKKNDLALFQAPTYGSLLKDHHYSYFGLVYLTSFTDYGKLYQPDPVGVPLEKRSPDEGDSPTIRRPLAHLASKLSLVGSLALAVIAVLGILASLKRLPRQLIRLDDHRHRLELSLLVLSLSFFLPFFFALPFTQCTYGWGYYLPRLTLSAWIGFVCLGFLFLDSQLRRSVAAQVAAGTYAWILAGIYLLCLC